MPDRVLLTGISGFLGGHVALTLLNAGYTVRGSVRDASKADKVRATLKRAGADVGRLEFCTLDLLDDAGWTEAMAGVRYLQHTASPFVTTMPADPMELVRPATEGTRRALHAAFTAGVERVVLTSSMAAISYGHPPGRTKPFTAADWTRLEGPHVNAYTESKTRAERVAWDIADSFSRRSDLVAINPTGIFGPLLDDDPGTSVGLLLRLTNGSVPAAPRVNLTLIDVRDVADLHLRAMTDPAAGGRRFPMANAPISLLDMARLIRARVPAAGRRLPRFEVPDWLVRIVANFDRDARDNLGELGTTRHVDASAATALLGRPFISDGDMLAASVESLIAQGLIRV